MKIDKKDVVIVLLLATLGAIFLVYGEGFFGWSELVRGNVSVFIFSVTTLYFSFSYDKWKKNKENEDKRKGILKGIYKEIVERARYLDYFKNLLASQPDNPYIPLFPPFPKSAWESAIANGYYDPQHQSWVDYSHIYSATDNFHLNANFANDIAYKATVPDEIKFERLYSILALLLNQAIEIRVIIDVNARRLAEELSISIEETKRLNDEISKRIKETLGTPKGKK